MDYQVQNTPPVKPAHPKDNRLSVASLVTGILSILSAFILPVYLPLIFAGVSITLALLSKGYERSMESSAKIGILTSTFGIILNVVIVIVCFYLVFNVPEYKKAFDDLCTQFYGETFEEMTQDIN